MGRAKNDFVRRYQVCMILVRTWHELSGCTEISDAETVRWTLHNCHVWSGGRKSLLMPAPSSRSRDRLITTSHMNFTHTSTFCLVSSPNMYVQYKADLWKTSVHWCRIFFGPKPMNCPGHYKIFAHRDVSYVQESTLYPLTLFTQTNFLERWQARPEYSTTISARCRPYLLYSRTGAWAAFSLLPDDHSSGFRLDDMHWRG